MKLLRTTALTAVLMTAAVPSLTSPRSRLGLGLARRRMGAGAEHKPSNKSGSFGRFSLFPTTRDAEPDARTPR
jgi:hypothetical protein